VSVVAANVREPCDEQLQRGHEDHAAPGHLLAERLVELLAVLDGVGARRHRVSRGLQVLGVGAHQRALLHVRLGHRDLQLLERVVLVAVAVVGPVVAAARPHLDLVGALAQERAHGLADLVGPVGQDRPEVVAHDVVELVLEGVAVTAGATEPWAAGDHPGARQRPLAKDAFEVQAVPGDVAHRGEAPLEQRLRLGDRPHRPHQLRLHEHAELLVLHAGPPAREVDVGVDETGRDEVAGAVDLLRPSSRRYSAMGTTAAMSPRSTTTAMPSRGSPPRPSTTVTSSSA
jgi:hypothetical protein